MPPTADIIFPDVLADNVTPVLAEVGGYEKVPSPRMAKIVFDNGASQRRKQSRKLYDFRYRTVPISADNQRTFHDFLDHYLTGVGNGDINFYFYEPEALRFAQLLVGITDGTDTYKVPFRRLDSWTDVQVGGFTVPPLGVAAEFYTFKEDQVAFDTPQLAGLPIVFFNVYARPQYVCHMGPYRHYPYKGGATEKDLGVPSAPEIPLFKRVWDMTFHEVGI